MPAKLFIAAAATLSLLTGAAFAQSVSETTCRSYGDTSTCTSTYTPPPKPTPAPEPFVRGPGSRQDVVWSKPSTVTEPRKPADNHCGPGFRMLRNYSCELLAR